MVAELGLRQEETRTTTRVAAAAACNGTDYNNCDVSTTATSTTGSDTESTTSADTDLDKKEKLLQQELMLDHAVLLPSYKYHDDIERYDKDQVLKAMKKELDKLREKEMYEEVRQHYSFPRSTTESCQNSLGCS